MILSDYVYIDQTSPSGLRWSLDRSNLKAGDVAGTLTRAGYYQTQIAGKLYYNHRLVAVLSGILPSLSDKIQIDHIDGNRCHNVPSNLRTSTHRQNQQNRPSHRRGKLVGAKFNGSSWESLIKVNGKEEYLGSYSTMQGAHLAYVTRLHQIGEVLQ